MINISALGDLDTLGEQIKAFAPKIKNFLPQLKDLENTEKSKLGLKPNELLLYCAMLGNGKVFIYVFRCEVLQKQMVLTTEGGANPEVLSEGTVIIKQEIKKIELIQYLDRIEKEGLISLVSEIALNPLVSKFL